MKYNVNLRVWEEGVSFPKDYIRAMEIVDEWKERGYKWVIRLMSDDTMQVSWVDKQWSRFDEVSYDEPSFSCWNSEQSFADDKVVHTYGGEKSEGL